MGRRGRRRTQLLYDLKETRIYRKLKEVAPGHTVLRTRFGRGYEPVARRTSDCTKSWSEYTTVWPFKDPTSCQQKQPQYHANLQVFGQVWRFRSSGFSLRHWVNGSRRFETTCVPVTQGDIPEETRPISLIILRTTWPHKLSQPEHQRCYCITRLHGSRPGINL